MLAVLLTVVVAVPSVGSTVIAETMDEAIGRAPVIVRARARQSQAGSDGHRIWTWTELTVTEVLKGQVGQVLLVKQPGGVVGARGQAVTGVAQFTPDEDCVVMLEPAVDEVGVYIVRALSAGKVSLTTRLGAPVALRDLSGLTFAAPAGSSVRALVKEESFGSPEAFLARVRRVVKGVNQ